MRLHDISATVTQPRNREGSYCFLNYSNNDNMDEFESWNTSMDIPGAREFIVCNRQPSMTQVLRDVKRREHELLNCLCSILYDSKFVQRVVNGFEVLPLLGNLRCGAWYAEKPKATCYFKSTDGHTGQWSFSLTRLNLHVADMAVEYGGVCIVDATRRGKRFPVRSSQTVVIGYGFSCMILPVVILVELCRLQNLVE